MDFTLPPEIEDVRLRTRRFVEEQVLPLESDRANYDEYENIRIEVGPTTLGDRDLKLKNLKLIIPAGVPAGLLVSFQHKLFVEDLVLAKTDRAKLERKLAERLGSEAEGKERAAMLDRLAGSLLRNLSSGEFTRVVQRVPVRIAIDRDARWSQLRPGLSATVAIRRRPPP